MIFYECIIFFIYMYCFFFSWCKVLTNLNIILEIIIYFLGVLNKVKKKNIVKNKQCNNAFECMYASRKNIKSNGCWTPINTRKIYHTVFQTIVSIKIKPSLPNFIFKYLRCTSKTNFDYIYYMLFVFTTANSVIC